ncbi:hypothetical protein HanRHA438_Chr03g0143671 [Helianthus annuus]|nr:hypothetical protein HanRHA438_Chr03g0143671 [Helianthus annuus]
MTRNRAVASGPLGLEWAVEPKPVWAETPKPNPKHPLVYISHLSPLLPFLHTQTLLKLSQLETLNNTPQSLPIFGSSKDPGQETRSRLSLGHSIFSVLFSLFSAPPFITG